MKQFLIYGIFLAILIKPFSTLANTCDGAKVSKWLLGEIANTYKGIEPLYKANGEPLLDDKKQQRYKEKVRAQYSGTQKIGKGCEVFLTIQPFDKKVPDEKGKNSKIVLFSRIKIVIMNPAAKEYFIECADVEIEDSIKKKLQMAGLTTAGGDAPQSAGKPGAKAPPVGKIILGKPGVPAGTKGPAIPVEVTPTDGSKVIHDGEKPTKKDMYRR